MANPPNPRELFGDAQSAVEVADKFESYKAALDESLSKRVAPPNSPSRAFQQALQTAQLHKAVSPDVVESLQASMSLNKDLNVAGPGSTGGLVAYDLQAPALQLAPRSTPLRNSLPRHKGIGTSHRFKRITGWSNSGTGGVSDLWAGITETTTNTVGGLPWRRGPVMEYAGDQMSVPYMTFSVSNSVTWEAEFAGYGYQDLRQMATTTLMYSSMLFEEKLLIEGRGTASPYGGALGAPTGVTVTCAAPGTEQTPTSGATSKVWAVVTAVTRWGETPISASGNGSWTSGQLATVSWTPVTGAYQYRVFVGTGSSDPTATAEWLYTTTSATTVAVQGALPTSGTAASTVTNTDTTARDTGYDGILANILGPHSGCVNRINGPLTATNPGDEIQKVCGTLFQNVQARPQEVLCNGFDRKQLTDTLKTQSSNNYNLVLTQPNQHSAELGALVVSIQNEITGDYLKVSMNPWWPQGTMGVMSWSLPVPDTNVSEVWALYGPQDLMSVEWPAQQFTYDSSTFWQNALVCFAPEFNGAVTGIVKA